MSSEDKNNTSGIGERSRGVVGEFMNSKNIKTTITNEDCLEFLKKIENILKLANKE